MHKLHYDEGAHVFHNEIEYEIIKVVDLETILVRNIATQEKELLPLHEVSKKNPSTLIVKYSDVNEISEKDWDEAKRRLEIIKPFLNTQKTKTILEEHAKKFNLHVSTLYRWIDEYQKSDLLVSLVPKHSLKGAKGSIRIKEETELITKKTIEDLYLSKQKYSAKKTYRAIVQRCKNARIDPPSENTVRSRIKDISAKEKMKHRESARLADRQYRNTDGMFPAGKYPLDFVQIDHTPMDIIVVDEVYGKPIGRPYLTIGIDVYSRMITGFFISLDEPSYFSVAQCLTQSILPKEKYLRSLEIPGSWNLWGIPKTIGLDNASEFRGKDLQRACEYHGIEINWRPVARPQFGGHIERLIGTTMGEVHTLPGTTFSNIKQRGEYKSDKEATMTLSALEKWFTDYIVNVYHKDLHSGIKCSPEKKYEFGIFGNDTIIGRGIPERIIDEDNLKISFLPTVERSIQQTGVKIDNIQYYADSLRRWIKAKNKDNNTTRKFIFKRDLRDISTIWFYDPDIKEYFPISYRNISYPPISIWDLRAIKKYLDDQNVVNYDEMAIFTAHDRMKKIEEASASTVKSIRRKHVAQKNRADKQKFDNLPKIITQKTVVPIPEENTPSLHNVQKKIEPFEDIEIL